MLLPLKQNLAWLVSQSDISALDLPGLLFPTGKVADIKGRGVHAFSIFPVGNKTLTMAKSPVLVSQCSLDTSPRPRLP